MANENSGCNSDDSLGPVVRLWGISPDELPKDDPQASQLAIKVLREAIPFIDSVPQQQDSPLDNNPECPWKPNGVKKSHPSTASITLSQRIIPREALATISPLLARSGSVPETWICRRSVHDDTARPGTASWAEVARCFRDEHSQSEAHFTPTVVCSRVLQRWDVGAESEVAVVESSPWLELGGRRWGKFSMELVEARHRIAPCGVLRDRVFTVLLVTATATAAGTPSEESVVRDEFVVVSVPVRDADVSQNAELSRASDVILGAYASVERFRLMSDGHSCWKREIEWIMATASDAKGVLPPWVQARAVPGQISKDVGLFVGWIEKCRKGDGMGGGERQGGRMREKRSMKRLVDSMRQPAVRGVLGYNNLEGEKGDGR